MTLRDAERLDRELGGHDVAVVALGQGEEDVGAFGAGPTQDVLVGAVAADGGARRTSTAAGRTRRVDDVEDDDLVAGARPTALGAPTRRRGRSRR